MLAEAIELQERAVRDLCKQIKMDKKIITFKAPTGSGKTYMMGMLMDSVLAERDDVIFLVSSLSKGNLAGQNYDNFQNYSEGLFPHIRPYLINSEISGEEKLYIPDDYNVYVLPRDLYKETSRLNQGAMDTFMLQIKMTGRKIFVIKDECHIKTKNLDALDGSFDKILNFSATPKLDRGQQADVEITEQEAIRAKLIKMVNDGDESDDITVAIEELLKLQKGYIQEGFNMRPALIVQISNKDKAEEEFEDLKRVLSNYSELHWCSITQKKGETNDEILYKLPFERWKDEVKKKESTVDIIIFKMVISEGWDIPRATILYQIRDSQSKQLDEQVMGRVRRNPMLLNFEKLSEEGKKLATTAYVWGIREDNSRPAYEVKLKGDERKQEIQNEIEVVTTRLQKITDVKSFDVGELIAQQENNNQQNIFTLYRQNKIRGEAMEELFNKYVDDGETWFSFMNNVSVIEKEVKDVETNYDKTMEIVKDEFGKIVKVTVPFNTYYVDEGHQGTVNRWIWERKDGKTKFSFDSAAEKEWCDLLNEMISDSQDNDTEFVKKLKVNSKAVFLFGKNFYPNSKICFEYYLQGIHKSYPDFIFKDYKNNFHLFEVKSVDGDGIIFDPKKYEDKIIAILQAYRVASKKTGYYFYVPIKMDNKWVIWRYYNGEEKEFTEEEFRESFANL